jgi:hypothetical protein
VQTEILNGIVKTDGAPLQNRAATHKALGRFGSKEIF